MDFLPSIKGFSVKINQMVTDYFTKSLHVLLPIVGGGEVIASPWILKLN